MKLLVTFRYIFDYLPKALALSPIIFLTVIAAEGLQHVVEWQLNMYESQSLFQSQQSNPVRLSFGILKALSVLLACYFIPRKLSAQFGPLPQFGSFNRDFIRKLWDPRGGINGLLAMLLCVTPLILIHYTLSELAMGHSLAALFLIVDSIVIGLLALVMGTAIWAGDAAEANLVLPQN